MEFTYWHWVTPTSHFLLNEKISYILLTVILDFLQLESKCHSNAYRQCHVLHSYQPISSNYTYSSLHASHSIINLPPQTVVVPKPVYQALTLNTITFFPNNIQLSYYNRLSVHWYLPTSSSQ